MIAVPINYHNNLNQALSIFLKFIYFYKKSYLKLIFIKI